MSFEAFSNFLTFETKYGKITLYKNDVFIIQPFLQGGYWDEDTLLKLKEYINPNRNILEIGGHCGTSSIVYASFLNEGKKVYVYEPQKICMNYYLKISRIIIWNIRLYLLIKGFFVTKVKVK